MCLGPAIFSLSPFWKNKSGFIVSSCAWCNVDFYNTPFWCGNFTIIIPMCRDLFFWIMHHFLECFSCSCFCCMNVLLRQSQTSILIVMTSFTNRTILHNRKGILRINCFGFSLCPDVLGSEQFYQIITQLIYHKKDLFSLFPIHYVKKGYLTWGSFMNGQKALLKS